MKKKPGIPITVLYGAPDIMSRKRKRAEKEDYPHCYEEEPETRDTDEGEEEEGRPAFVCVYASPEWFAQHHGIRDEKDLEAAPSFCPRCGAKVIPGANYCSNCGLKLNKEVNV